MMALAVFVRRARHWLMTRLATRSSDSGSSGPLSIVLGNESADLDSVACALCLAYAQSSPKEDGPAVVPVINVPREDLALRTEVTFMLKRLGIPESDLVCRDDIDLANLASTGSLAVTLVDHNRLASHQQFLKPCVTRIVDHHVNEELFEPGLCTIRTTGSCSSLVADLVVARAEEARQPLDASVAELLLGAVLTDTVNLDRSKGRTYDEDKAAAAKLRPLVQTEVQELFLSIQKAKFDCSHLTTSQLLRKDYKEIEVGSLTVGFPALTMPLEQLLQREWFLEDLEQFKRSKYLDIVVLMATIADPEFARQLALYTHTSLCSLPWWSSFVSQVEAHEELQLVSLRPDTRQQQREALQAFHAYQQQNITKSRKAVLPFIRETVQGLEPISFGDRKVIGLTGRIGSGKTTVASMLRKLGAVVFESDTLAHDLYAPGTPTHTKIVAWLGEGVVAEDGGIDRRAVGQRVFGNQRRLVHLTQLVWPALFTHITEQIKALPSSAVVVIEAALLIPAGWHVACSQVWQCIVSDAVAASRLKGRGLSEEEVQQRRAAQVFPPHKIDRAIHNSTTLQELEASVQEAWKEVAAD